MIRKNFCIPSVFQISLVLGCLCWMGCDTSSTDPLISPAAQPGADIIMQVAAAQNEDPYAAGRAAAKALHANMAANPPHAVIVVECFDDKSLKKDVLKGISTVFPKEKIYQKQEDPKLNYASVV